VVQDLNTGAVLVLASTNREMLAKTLETGDAWFWSRSRQQPWHKGETSGNFIRVREVRRNCEDDSLLFLAEPTGPVCHTGAPSCYYRTLGGAPVSDGAPGLTRAGGIDWLFDIVASRQREMPVGSYTTKLLREGTDRVAQKVGEEAIEVIIAAKNRSREELASEMADLWYHALVLLADAGMTPNDVYRVLAARHKRG
jgi:phosphoribosyl-ATP pyrophosphohydrolase/phosphoribosyl-AMP cyclohydrolase